MEVCFQTTTDLFVYFWWSDLSYSFPLVPGTTSVEEKRGKLCQRKEAGALYKAGWQQWVLVCCIKTDNQHAPC